MPALSDLPTGTVTFLFTDIEGSTRLVQDLGDAYPPLLEQHHDIVRSAVETNDGLVVSTEGDSFFAVFPAAPAALRAAVGAQLALARHPWPDDARIRVRMGLHTCEGRIGAGSYVGVEVHRGARIGAAGHGGQVLLSAGTAQLAERALPPEVSLIDLGEHRLRDLLQPERIFQVEHPELAAEFPPLKTLNDRPNNLPMQTSELVGRDRELREIRDRELREIPGPARRPGRASADVGRPGDIGKTRLAVQVGAEHTDLAPDGVYFIDLSPVTDADAAFDAVARAVGASGTGGCPPKRRSASASASSRS